MAYYVYENWVAENKAVVHDGSCSYCNDGKGCHDNPLGDKNGRWHGPFDTKEQAQEAAKATGRLLKNHRCVS